MNKEKIPPISFYKQYLERAVEKFKIPINEARDKFGLFTVAEWEKLLEDDKNSQ